MATIVIHDIDENRNHPDLEAALVEIDARPYHSARDANRLLTEHLVRGCLVFRVDVSRDASEVARTPVTLPDGTRTTVAEVIQAEGLAYTIEGSRRGRRLDKLVWAPGAPDRPRVIRRKTIPSDIDRNLDEWVGISDAELGRKLIDHFFATV